MKKTTLMLLFLGMAILYSTSLRAQQNKLKDILIKTRWAENVNVKSPLNQYPRPNLVRDNWNNLNGLWEYTITAKDAPKPTHFSGQILVPYPIESALSGVKRSLLPTENLWYKRTIQHLESNAGNRFLLHFGAVDWRATLYINGIEVGNHSGGYTSFSFDISNYLIDGANEILVKVYDPTNLGFGPHGKQDLNPANIFYTPSSGIWQTVWLEIVPAEYIEDLTMTPDIDKGVLNLTVNSRSIGNASVKVFDGKRLVAFIPSSAINNQIAIPIKNAKLWSPEHPFLYNLEVRMGKDKVKSYFGMRKVSINKDKNGVDRIFLNNKYTYNLGTLDQGFWPDGLYTAPTDEALAFDIKAIKAMGFNTIRKHIKVEPSRWYFWADKLGILVWQDLVNPPQNLPEGSKAEFEKESKEIVSQLHNYPSIITWVLFNEKWGQYDQERLTMWLKEVDPSRLVNGHSGEKLFVNDKLRSESPNAWIGADMTDVHAYPNPGHIAFVNGKVAVLGEFGGIGVPIEGHLWDDLVQGWGYDGIVTPLQMMHQYSSMIDSLIVLEKKGLTASIYTQPFDVESEQNGLITYDREVIKIPIDSIRHIHGKLLSFAMKKKYEYVNLKLADTIENYHQRLKEYQAGRRDSTFLRRLAILSASQKDKTNHLDIVDQYISRLNCPLAITNLLLIQAYTTTLSGKGFRVFMNNVEKINNLLGKDAAEAKITGIIESEEITPKLSKDTPINWLKMESDMVSKYGELGEESVWQTKVLYSFNHGDFGQLESIIGLWFEKYGSKRKWINPRLLNGLSWGIFENTDKREFLESALALTTHAIKMDDAPELYDTHANLLYKLGHKTDALIWEERALNGRPDSQDIKTNLQKMRDGLPTWPEKK